MVEHSRKNEYKDAGKLMYSSVFREICFIFPPLKNGGLQWH